MPLPDSKNAYIPPEKLSGYLLSETHAVGKAKARFFRKMEEVNELDTVVLNHDLPEHGLAQGDVGTVVHRYGDGEAVEVEFVTGEGETVAVLTLEVEEIRLMKRREILHVREMAA